MQVLLYLAVWAPLPRPEDSRAALYEDDSDALASAALLGANSINRGSAGNAGQIGGAFGLLNRPGPGLARVTWYV